MKFDSPPTDPDTGLKKEKIKKLFGHCFEISKFEGGDQIPVGGESVFSSETNITVEGDFKNFSEFFRETHEALDKINLPKLKEWLSSQGFDLDDNLFAELFAFTKKFEQKYPNNPARAKTRKELYREKGEQLKLSDIFGANSAECAEIAALAQMYLQQEGVSSSYFSGDVLWEKEDEFSGEHTFIIVRHNGKIYIYDPTNPTETTSGKFPSLYTVVADFDIEMAKGEKRFVTAKNIISKKEAYFGVNNGTNVSAQRHIV
jgi:hypothetical protein